MTSLHQPPAAGEPEATPSPPIRQAGQDEPPWLIWMAPAAIALGLGLGELAVIVVSAIGTSGGSSFNHPGPAVSIISDVVVDLAFVLAAVYVVSLRGRPRPADFGFRRTTWRLGIAAFLLAGAGYYVLTWAYAALFKLHGSDKLPSELGVGRSTAALIGAALFVCVVAPIAEEFFFRGFLFGVLRRIRIRVFRRDLGTWFAAILTGVLFGLAHTGSASSQYLVPLGFLGFVLCLMRWWTRSLYPCMALHAFNNSLALGVNELHWSAAGILGLVAASLLVIAATTAPLAKRASEPALRAGGGA